MDLHIAVYDYDAASNSDDFMGKYIYQQLRNFILELKLEKFF
jgi:hypothetical protein